MTEFLGEALERELDYGIKELVINCLKALSDSILFILGIVVWTCLVILCMFFAGCFLSREVAVFFIPESVHM